MIRQRQINHALKALLRFMVLLLIGASFGYSYFSYTSSANANCSRRIKYDIVDKSDEKYGSYYANVYLPKYSYNRRNLSEVFTCILNDNPTYDSFYIRIYTDKSVIPVNEICDFSLDPFIGLESWDAVYSRNNSLDKTAKRNDTFRYRPILWFPFYHRTIALIKTDKY